MEKVIVNGEALEAERGSKLSRLLVSRGLLKMPCAGRGVCGKCKVKAQGALSPLDDIERQKLTPQEIAAGIRLACRAQVQGTCDVFLEAVGSQVLLEGSDVIDAGGDPLYERLGAAVDVGTSTLAARLYEGQKQIAQGGRDNPQAVYGADVISRMEKSLAGEGPGLARAIRAGIAELLTVLCEKSGHRVEEIDTLVITGNTVMLYLLTGRDPKCLTRAPFIADWLAGEWTDGEALALPCRAARIWLPPCMSAFVGADITTALLAVDIRQGASPRLLADIGTNGEIALWKDNALFVCSTAAGPAFEGAGLSMGMQAEAGAISHVRATTEGLDAEVIGGGVPKGICGSGVIDAVSSLLRIGSLDETGYLEEGEALIAGDVKLDQEDIRKVQLAKSAICAGIQTMLHQAGLVESQLQELLIAGGFGSYLQVESAMAIGLLPPVAVERIKVCGNAALAGAAWILQDRARIQEAKKIADCAHTLNLASDAFFQEQYMEGMFFPEI